MGYDLKKEPKKREEAKKQRREAEIVRFARF
jgi:hypothetical protein